jgi:L-cysteine desulfidase
MKGKDLLLGTFGFIAVIFIVLFFDEKEKNKLLINSNEDLKKDKFKLIEDSINKNKSLTPEVKNQIEKLILEFKNSHPDVSYELRTVLEQIKNGYEIKAIRDLAKIIENLLREKYQNESHFSNAKRITLKPLIDYAKDVNFFNKKLFNVACILHQFRNEESHELNVKDSENIKMAAILGGIEIILFIKAS